MAGLFQTVRSARPGRSVFNLSYEKKFTADMGQLIPVMCDEVIPGDKWKIGNQMIIRFQPLVAPILHEVNVFVHYFLSRIAFSGMIGKNSLQRVLMEILLLLSLVGLLQVMRLGVFGTIWVCLLVLL